MIVISCRKCGSENIRKNGFTKAGARKYHCKACKFYGTPVTQEEKQNKKEEQADYIEIPIMAYA